MDDKFEKFKAYVTDMFKYEIEAAHEEMEEAKEAYAELARSYCISEFLGDSSENKRKIWGDFCANYKTFLECSGREVVLDDMLALVENWNENAAAGKWF